MMSRSQPLHTYITGSSWHQTLALLAAHQLPRTATQTKTVLQAVLTHHLLQPAVIEYSITELDAVGKDALRALLAAGGVLPVHTFEERFDPIRPYRP